MTRNGLYTINAYTATGAIRAARRLGRERGWSIRNAVATLLPRSGWIADAESDACDRSDHAGQRNVTYHVTFTAERIER